MKLKYSINKSNNYVITETRQSWVGNDVIKDVEYTRDLKQSRCNDEPFSPTYPASIEWFKKHYAPKFDRIERAEYTCPQ